METDLFEHIKTLLEAYVTEWRTPENWRMDGVLPADALEIAVQTLVQDQFGYLTAITGIDNHDANLEVLYHFCSGRYVLTLRVSAPHKQPILPSITPILAYAGLFEREISEMLGITFTGIPDASRLFLPDDWQEGLYPLRKNVDLGQISNDEHT